MIDIIRSAVNAGRSKQIDAQVSWFALACCAVVGLAVFYSWHWVVPVRSAWNTVDHTVFYALNGSLALHEGWLYFWVLASSRWFDAIPGLVILGYYATLLRGPAHGRWAFWASQLAWIFIFLYFWQDYVVDLVMEHRASPSHTLEPFINVKHVLEWVPDVKSGSYDSFPGDHASVLVFFSVIFACLLERKYSLQFLLIAPLFCLPRLMSGAHWLSDVTVGGVTCGLVGAAVFLGLRNSYLQVRDAWRWRS